MSKQAKIYVSYAWTDENEQGESREQIVDEIQNTIEQSGYKLIRDKKDLSYGQSIEKFMQELGQGDFIVVVLSDKYLKSEYCMGEVLELMRSPDYLKKVLPVILPDANIFDRKARKKYLKYWIDEYNDIIEDIKDFGDNVPKSYFDDRDFLEKLKRIIDEFARSIANINSLNPKLLRENNYKDIINYIQKNNPNMAKHAPSEQNSNPSISSNLDYGNINSIDVDGDGNIILQDVSGQNITINYNDTSALNNMIQSLLDKQTMHNMSVLEELKKMQEQQNQKKTTKLESQPKTSKDKFRTLISQNIFDEFFVQAKEVKLDETAHNMLIMIESQWNQLKNDKMMGILSGMEQKIQMNQIRNQAIQFISQYL
ncbi:MAG: toll/interleukin-1 receptor domain-containing protein [Bacteroidales bacterium]|nr:toll/interleukin-1 receptor domain-containing protein [Bacteroidales bacterium]